MEKSEHPLHGEGAYKFDALKTDDFIKKGSFGMVFRCIRKYDGNIFAIKISKNQFNTLDDNEK
jgi:hypothetical protein